MLRLFNKIFVHKDSSYEHLENGDLSECVQSNYFTENDNYIDSYENALIPAPERVTRHVCNFSNLKMLIIADLHGHFRNYEKELKNISETDYDYTDDIHDGLMGVTKYLYKNQVTLCIHGHIHENKSYTLQNGTTVLSCYGIQLVTLKNVIKE